MKPIRSFTFLGKRWKLLLVPRLGEGGKKDDGKTDGPHIKDKTIRIRQGQTPYAELETYIHEFLHACCWWLDEEYVHQIAEDIARALWRMGFRKVDP